MGSSFLRAAATRLERRNSAVCGFFLPFLATQAAFGGGVGEQTRSVDLRTAIRAGSVGAFLDALACSQYIDQFLLVPVQFGGPKVRDFSRNRRVPAICGPADQIRNIALPLLRAGSANLVNQLPEAPVESAFDLVKKLWR